MSAATACSPNPLLEPPSGDRSPRLSWPEIGWLVAILLMGAYLRGGQVTDSLWLDELHTSWVVADGVAEVAARARAGNQSPLYYYLVSGVVIALGHTEWTLRLISLVAGLALIVSVHLVVRRWSGSMASGLLAALLVALNHDCIFYAQEARPYALVQLSAAVHAALFATLLRQPSPARRIWFVGGAIWLFYLHYTTLLFLAGEVICYLLLAAFAARPPVYAARQFLVDLSLAAVSTSAAVPHLLRIAARRDHWARIVDAWPSRGLQITFLVFVLLPLVGWLIAAALRLPRRFPRSLGDRAVWGVCWFVVPTLLAWLSTVTGWAALFMLRYLVAALTGAIVFAGCVVALSPARWYRALLGTVIVLVMLAAQGMIQQWRVDGRWIGDRNERWSEAVTWLNEVNRSDSRPVLLCPGLLEDRELQPDSRPALRQYCLFAVRGLYRLEAAELEPLPTVSRVRLDDRQQRLIEGDAWVILRAGAERTEQIVAALADATHTRVQQRRQFGSLTVVRLCRPVAGPSVGNGSQ